MVAAEIGTGEVSAVSAVFVAVGISPEESTLAITCNLPSKSLFVVSPFHAKSNYRTQTYDYMLLAYYSAVELIEHSLTFLLEG